MSLALSVNAEPMLHKGVVVVIVIVLGLRGTYQFH